MGWQRREDAEGDDAPTVAEELVRDDDGQVLGTVTQFDPDGPTYAWLIHDDGAAGATRLGAFTRLDTARAAVEEARLAFKGPGSGLPGAT